MIKLEPVRSRGVVDAIVQQIVDAIRSGQVGEGDVLPSERIMAAQMEVSRPTVRQALARLASAGVLQSSAGRSGQARVVSIWIPDGLTEALDPQRNADEVFRLLEARRVLEPRVAQLAAMRATAADFERMQKSIELLEANQENLVKAAQAETQFHRAMWAAANNPVLEKMLVDVARELGAVRDSMLRTPRDFRAGVKLHEATLTALRRGDPDEIEAVTIRHLAHFEGIVEEVLGRPATPRLPRFLRNSPGHLAHE